MQYELGVFKYSILYTIKSIATKSTSLGNTDIYIA